MARRAAVLGSVRSALADGPLSDRDLLRRYSEHGDQTAFAAVVRRHTGLVLGVCRAALHSEADAEDACQAVFLVLARKAGSVSWRESVANWLHATARRVAHNARLAAVRRARREGAAAVPETVQPIDRMTGRELLTALDEELDRLPIHYREPLLLCCLEGLSRTEAAARLGVPEATLKSQLERGRKRLAEALTRRGVGLGAGLLAAAATSPAGASSPRLVEAILVAVVGEPSPAVAALAREVAMNGILTKLKLTALALAGAALLGFGLAPAPIAAGPPAATPLSAEAPQAPPTDQADPTERTFTGRVLDAEGRPVAAALHLVWTNGKPVPLGNSGSDGAFRVAVPVREPWAYLVATADGHGLCCLMPNKDTPADLTLRLTKEQRIRGRVIDDQGRPLEGVTVRILSIQDFGGSMQEFLDAWKRRTDFRQQVAGRKELLQLPSTPFLSGRTDATGHFELRGLGAERLVRLKLGGVGRARALVHVITRAGFDPKPYNDATLALRPTSGEQLSWDFNPLFLAPDFTFALESEKPLRGRVTDAATGLPRAGIAVRLDQDDGTTHQVLSGKTDADGRYEIRGAKKWRSYRVRVPEDGATVHLPCVVQARDTVGYEPVVVDFACPRGVVVRGTVRDKVTRKPVAGHVRLEVLSDNAFLKRHPVLGSQPNFDRVFTGPDGRFRVIALPGPMLLSVQAVGPVNGKAYRFARPDPKYPQYFHRDFGFLGYYGPGGVTGVVDGHWCQVLDVAEGSGEVVRDIELESGPRRDVKLVDAAGKPVQGAHVSGTVEADFYPAEPLGEADTARVHHLEPEKPRLVVAIHRGRRLAGAARVVPGDGPEVLTLGSGGRVVGRLTGTDGKPLAGVSAHLYFERREVQEAYGARLRATTDAAGRFAFDGLLPGFDFRVLFSRSKKSVGPEYDQASRHRVAKDGEVVELGEMKVEVGE